MQHSGECEKMEGMSLRVLEEDELRELLFKNWMTHDGMWFLHCLQECGIEKANKINKAAVRSMAKVELRRIMAALSVEKIQSFSEFKEFANTLFKVVKAKFMDFEYEFPEFNILKFTMNNCFAYDGVKRIGVIEQYECGIFERLKGWFEELRLNYKVDPQVNGCMMVSEGKCYRTFRFEFVK